MKKEKYDIRPGDVIEVLKALIERSEIMIAWNAILTAGILIILLITIAK